MQLYISPTSPFARKAQVVMLEKGLGGEINAAPMSPWQDPAELVAHNPLSQVPVLILQNGEALYDSRVICAFLDQLSPSPVLVPREGFEKFRVMRLEALADGVADAAVIAYFARQQTEAAGGADKVARQLDKIRRALPEMEAAVRNAAATLDLGLIATGCVLGYLDLRWAELNWRDQAPELAAWFEEFANRDAMIKTAPPM